MKELSLEQMEQVEGGFLILCVAGGPITFGICLGIALVLLSTPAY
ncbi:MAG: class IIb bacteriocin, lactobin A/cerein 7B family [Cyclobacteriaceae bacterium]|nr:class IIb bacteriocin, lactobin A/cerein 7B family [Cyclobacteriaceae bacterium]